MDISIDSTCSKYFNIRERTILWTVNLSHRPNISHLITFVRSNMSLFYIFPNLV